MSNDKDIDWEKIEFDYRAGVMSLREIGELHEVNYVKIKRRADKEGWDRDLTARIQAKAKALVTKQPVTADETEKRLVTENETITENANLIANVIRSHRTGLANLQKVCDDLMSELVTQSISKEALQQIAELAILQQTQDGDQPDPKDVQKRLDSFLKLLGLSDRADTFKKLVDAKTRLVTLERTIFDFDKGAGTKQSLGEFLESLQ